MYGFDTSLIAGDDRGGDAFGALTFTRVLGQAWELHGEAAWREQEAILLGGKYTTQTGISFIGEFYTPPNIPYYRDMFIAPSAGRSIMDLFMRANRAFVSCRAGSNGICPRRSSRILTTAVTPRSSTPTEDSAIVFLPICIWKFRKAARLPTMELLLTPQRLQ